MSSVAVFPPAELPSLLAETPVESLAVKRAHVMGVLSSSVRPASALEVRPAPAMVPFGIVALDALTGGVPRGGLTELVGPASSGRTSVMLSLMASVTRRQEVCALVDVTDSFDPASAEAAGVDLQRTLWVRCGKTVPGFELPVSGSLPRNTASDRRRSSLGEVAPPAKNISWSIHENYDTRLRHAIAGGCYEMVRRREVADREASRFPFPVSSLKRVASAAASHNSKPETRNPSSKWAKLDQALRATDLLLQNGGFGLIVIDLADISIEQSRRVPLTSWFRFRRVVENTPTMLLLVARDSCAKTCASLVLQLRAQAIKSGQQVSRCELPVSSEPRDKESKTRSSKLQAVCSSHVNLLDGLDVHVELVRTRLGRKPARSVDTRIETQTSWRKSG